MEKFLPTIMMFLSLGSAIGYACTGNLRMTTYWFAAAVITAAVTF